MPDLTIKRVTFHSRNLMTSSTTYHFELRDDPIFRSEQFVVKLDYRAGKSMFHRRNGADLMGPAIREAFPSAWFKKRGQSARYCLHLSDADFAMLELQSEWMTIHGN